jgi:MOSC domain-containing protein YiiM
MGQLLSIVYKPRDAVSDVAGYARPPLPEARLIVGHGIDGDAKGGSPNRHLNIMAAETVHALQGEGFRASPGQLGEQLILSGIDVDALPVGTRLQIGASACVELTEPRTGCGKFERHQGKRKEEASGRLGMMARVIAEGIIRVGDPVQIVDGSRNAGVRSLSTRHPGHGNPRRLP